MKANQLYSSITTTYMNMLGWSGKTVGVLAHARTVAVWSGR